MSDGKSKYKTKNNHFVPRTYQKRWVIPDNPGHIGVYAKCGTYDVRTIKRNAALLHFYEQELEDALQPIETAYGNVMVKVLRQETLEPADRAGMVRFISTQLRRNLVGQTRMDHFAASHLDVTRGNVKRDIDEMISSKSGSVIEKLAHSVASEMKLDRTTKHVRAGELSKFLLTGGVLAPMPRFERILGGLWWQIYVSDGEKEFVTSDNPVIMPLKGLLAEKRVHFPLSPDMCLVAKHERPRGPDYLLVNGKRVKRINQKTIAAAREEVYVTGPFLSKETVSKIGTKIWAETLGPDGDDW